MSYIVQRLKADIARGVHPPGARLSPNILATDYHVSHIPVREALNSLAARGYITYQRSRGFFARELSDDELEDLYRWRHVLETEAYRIVVPLLTDEDFARMQAIIDETVDLQGKSGRLRYLELNRQFHFVAFERVGSPVLLHLLNYLWDSAAPYLAADLIDSKRAHKDHQRMIDLYRARDVESLIQLMDRHRNFRREMVARSQTVTHRPGRKKSA